MLEQKKTRRRTDKMITDETTGAILRWCSAGAHYEEVLKFGRRSGRAVKTPQGESATYQSSCRACVAERTKARRALVRQDRANNTDTLV